MKITFIFLITSTLVVGCSSLKAQFNQTGDRNEAIQNAVLDFSSTKLFIIDTVFSIKTGDINENTLIVRIGKNNTKLLLTDSTKVGSKGKLPSRYIEKDGKLFFWWDDEYPLTEETLSILQKYNLLQDDEGGIIKFPDFVINDAQKAAHYYFCKNNLTRYKKVITNKGIGNYTTPNLKCIP